MRFSHRTPFAAALGALSVATIPSVFAADAPAADEFETIVVTATRGRESSNLETPVPVDVVDASQLASAGAVGGELGQALQVLVPSFNLPRQSNSGSGDLVRPAQLRGMSPDQVLVLVNGKRRHTTSITGIDTKIGRGTAPVDFNSIPSNAIRRVEVLRDGAGAQYGSDAIAGVINVILDDRAEGIDTAVSYGKHFTDFDPIDDSIEDGATTSVQGSAGLALG
ncbi:MAG: TonB-dependent receptor plug domain-containing protein, partial [Gammaproteobacteria bacterium]|nr:TonB-dependent receptor plug domain-containing protein [Gammaproteobacteria bacterium]